MLKSIERSSPDTVYPLTEFGATEHILTVSETHRIANRKPGTGNRENDFSALVNGASSFPVYMD